MKTQIKRVLAFCIDQYDKGNHCFFYYYPHVGGVELRCYKGEWVASNNSVFNKNVKIKLFTKKFTDELLIEMAVALK